MKSCKFNFYKFAKYFVATSLLILIAGLVMGFVLNMNLKEALGGYTIVYSAIALLITMVFSFVYLYFRYENTLAFSFTLGIFLNVALLVALCTIIRVPVGNIFVAAILATVFFTIVLNMPIFIKLWHAREEKQERSDMINATIKQSLKEVMLISLVLLAVLLVCLLIVDGEALMFIRPAVIGLIVSTLSAIFILPSVWGYFYRHKPAKKKKQDITVYSENEETETQPVEAKPQVEPEN